MPKRKKANEEAYDILQSMLSVEPRASFEIFLSNLHKKYKDRGLFGEFVMDRLRQSVESYPEIKTMGQLRYASLVIPQTTHAEKLKLRFDLWKETFFEMSPGIQELLLYGMKVDIEQRMMYQCMSPKTYEEDRYYWRNDAKVLVIEGYCKNCNLGYPVELILIEYTQRTNLRPNEPITHECPQCKNNSLVVPIL